MGHEGEILAVSDLYLGYDAEKCRISRFSGSFGPHLAEGR
jgi:hypothetical protein